MICMYMCMVRLYIHVHGKSVCQSDWPIILPPLSNPISHFTPCSLSPLILPSALPSFHSSIRPFIRPSVHPRPSFPPFFLPFIPSFRPSFCHSFLSFLPSSFHSFLSAVLFSSVYTYVGMLSIYNLIDKYVTA